MNNGIRRINCALISVSDKSGILELAQLLSTSGVEILSTGGTAKLLTDNQLKVTEVSDYTGFSEIMSGRVKTLHPKIHGGILGRRDQDAQVMKKNQITCIDLVVVNLYPFEQTIAGNHCNFEMAIENIDIGGPAMLRSAAKNHKDVTAVVDASDYQLIIDEITEFGGTRYKTRRALAAKVFAHTNHYDGVITEYLNADKDQPELPNIHTLQYKKAYEMRYGENPHQAAALYLEADPQPASLGYARLLQGKKLSYNNLNDADAALECVKEFDQVACVIVKHANPCGVALAEDNFTAYKKAYETDPTSAFGGIIAFNQKLDIKTVQAILDRQFVEVIVAPEIEPAALTLLSAKNNIRVLETGAWTSTSTSTPSLEYKKISGGMLIQQKDQGKIKNSDLSQVSKRKPTPQEIADMLLAWKIVKHVKSNAIVYVKNGATIGVGAGQMSRIYSTKIATMKAQDAGLEIKGSVMASDAFFPFRDSLDAAHMAGVHAVIQPGGSMRDDEVIAAANEHNIAMVFTGMRHFWH